MNAFSQRWQRSLSISYTATAMGAGPWIRTGTPRSRRTENPRSPVHARTGEFALRSIMRFQLKESAPTQPGAGRGAGRPDYNTCFLPVSESYI